MDREMSTSRYNVSTVIFACCVFLVRCNKILVVSQGLSNTREKNLYKDEKLSDFSFGYPVRQHGRVHENAEVENLNGREMENFMEHNKKLLIDPGSPWKVKDILRSGNGKEKIQKKIALLTKLIADSTHKDKLLPFKIFGQPSQKENQKRVKVSWVKAGQKESSYGGWNRFSEAVLPQQDTASKSDFSFVFVLISVSGLVFVVLICLHAPCCLRSQSRSSESKLKCPNRSLHEGVCGKCLLDQGAKRAAKTKAQKERCLDALSDRKQSDHIPHASISYDVNDDPFSSLQRPYTLQPLHFDNSERRRHRNSCPDHATSGCTGRLLRRTKEKSREFRMSRRGYKSMKHYDRSPDIHDPEWTSAGEFLNRRSRYREQDYGSIETDSFADRFRRRSRDSWGSDISVEDLNGDLIPPPKPRRRPLELQEFPLGYSKYYSASEHGRHVVFDPFHEGVNKISAYENKTEMYQTRLSTSDLQRKENKKSSWKSKLKWGNKGPSCSKSCPAIVQRFPTAVRYNAQYIQAGNYSENSRTRLHHSYHIQSIFEEDDTSMFQNTSYPVKSKQFLPNVGGDSRQSAIKGHFKCKPLKCSSTSDLQDSSSSLKEGKWSSDSSIKLTTRLYGVEPLAGLQSPKKKLPSNPVRKVQGKKLHDDECWHFHASSSIVEKPVKENCNRKESCAQDYVDDMSNLQSSFSNSSKHLKYELNNQSLTNNKTESLFTGLSVSQERDINRIKEDGRFSLSQVGTSNLSYYSSSEFELGKKGKCDLMLPERDEVCPTHAARNTHSYCPDLLSPPVKDIDCSKL